VPDQWVESLARTLVEHNSRRAAVGGLRPPENDSFALGERRCGDDWNPSLAGVALNDGVGIEPLQPAGDSTVELRGLQTTGP
jgi:hypothetical protein